MDGQGFVIGAHENELEDSLRKQVERVEVELDEALRNPTEKTTGPRGSGDMDIELQDADRRTSERRVRTPERTPAPKKERREHLRDVNIHDFLELVVQCFA